MDRVYELPNFPPAPTSDLQLLVRRLIEWGDFSTVLPILDELKGLGREGDCSSLRTCLMFLVKPNRTDYWNNSWDNFIQNLLYVFWYDLFSLEGTLERANQMRPVRNPEPMKVDASFKHAMQTIVQNTKDFGWPTPDTQEGDIT